MYESTKFLLEKYSDNFGFHIRRYPQIFRIKLLYIFELPPIVLPSDDDFSQILLFLLEMINCLKTLKNHIFFLYIIFSVRYSLFQLSTFNHPPLSLTHSDVWNNMWRVSFEWRKPRNLACRPIINTKSTQCCRIWTFLLKKKTKREISMGRRPLKDLSAEMEKKVSSQD